jgi:hypothetical protein
MRYARLLLAVLSALCLAAAAAHAQQAQAQACPLTIEQAPELRGFRLGMTTEQVMARVPGIQVQQGSFGASDARLPPSSGADAAAYKGIDNIYFGFLDGRLVNLVVSYDQSVHWKSSDQFAAKVSEFLKLPEDWRGTANPNQKVLTCAGFDVTVTAYPNAIRLAVPNYNEVLSRRREQHEEKLRQDFRP